MHVRGLRSNSWSRLLGITTRKTEMRQVTAIRNMCADIALLNKILET